MYYNRGRMQAVHDLKIQLAFILSFPPVDNKLSAIAILFVQTYYPCIVGCHGASDNILSEDEQMRKILDT